MRQLASMTSPRILSLALALGLSVTLLPAQPAQAAAQQIGGRFFGMTDGDPVSWPKAKVGSMRLWDSGVTWREIERAPGVFDFARLDAQVRATRANGARALLVLGMTPRFHSTRPNSPGVYGKGSTAMPRLEPWKRYVAKVVKRYGAQLDYQVWNEANVVDFWSGSQAQMAQLTRTASQIVNRNASSARVVAPALATRLIGQRKWSRDFYAQRTGGRKVGGWIDVVSLNLYPLPQDGPEASIHLIEASRVMLRAAGVTKPIWNTEVNYGLQTGGGGTARDISRRKEAAFVGRTYILNAANGIKRVFWYSWQIQTLANTQLTKPDGVTLAPAGTAYQIVGEWLRGTRMLGCVRDRRGTYTCTVRYSGGMKRIYWNPSRQVSVKVVGSATRREGLSGFTTAVDGGDNISVGASPVMVRSRR